MPHRYNENSRRVEEALAKLRGRSSTREIAEQVNLEASDVEKILRNLSDTVVIIGGRNHGTMWELRSQHKR